MIPAGWSAPTFWKCPSVFKQMLSKQVDWKRWSSSMAPKIARPKTSEFFPLGFCENIFCHLKIADL
jgi:hypothetical protein